MSGFRSTATRRLRALPAALLAGLLAVLLAAGGLLPAAAADEENPQILSPTTTDRLYTGFKGPFEVDFTFAPAATYTGTVSLLVPGEDPSPVGSPGEFVWDGVPPAQASFASASLGPGSYRFEVTDGNGHQDSLDFTVRVRPRCNLVAPTTVRVDRAEVIVGTRLATNCAAAGVTYASWDISHAIAPGNANLLTFPGKTRDTWTYAAGEPLGTYYATPVDAKNPVDDDILQNAPTTVIRLVSRLSLAATRDGRLVTLRGTLTRYTPSALGFRGWKAHRVVLSSRACDTCPWRTVATPLTNARGRIAVTVRSAAIRRYRITSLGTPGIWTPAADYLRK